MSSTTRPGAEKPHYPSVVGTGLRILATSLASPADDLPLRSFHRDALALAARFDPPFQVLGQDFIPSGGPCLLLSNHYYRPGFDAWQRALAISAAVPVEIRWIITSALTYPGRLENWFLGGLSRWYLARVAKVYGFFGMPPMPPLPQDAAARAAAVRKVVAYIRQVPAPVIGLTPEGRDILECRLDWPPSGAGRFVLQLAKMGLRSVPVGVYEEGGCLWLHFGPDFKLEPPPGMAPGDLDCWASRQVMEHIARLLPERLRGEFGGTDGNVFNKNRDQR